VGLVESRYRSNGQAVFAPSRFQGHLLTNVLGALAAFTFWWVAESTTGFNQFYGKFPYDAMFNVMVPLSAVAVFAFVRWQQVDAFCKADRHHRIDDVMDDSIRGRKIAGFSLGHLHQTANVLHLVVVTSIAATSFLLLVAYGMQQAKTGHPLVMSWQVIATILATLGFLYACGGPWSRGHKAVYLTFLTGTPAALGGAILWLSWFRNDATRNAFAVSIVVVGYVLYCVEVVLTDWAEEGERQLHYFAATAVAVVLAVLLGTVYLS
jgi:hypothetical protein